MVAIEQDVPPFGIIDDGSDFINRIESDNIYDTGWHDIGHTHIIDEDW